MIRNALFALAGLVFTAGTIAGTTTMMTADAEPAPTTIAA